MKDLIGSSLAHYRVTAAIGAGGMGAVYRATDTKLNRDVAIKVLPDLFANDPERLARFTREAQTLAALNHPNIAQIYGLEESGDVRALVMELIDGEELSAHIARGPMPLNEALPIARQIADALEAAHELGIVHRDLKPANIKVRPDGTIKVLDFGLAKAMDPVATSGGNAAASPTMTARATQLGVIIGTAAYMAPEQARGRVVDRRADIWAFGVVLYEMLTGRRAFDGDDISITLANVLKDDVSWQALPADLPGPLRRLLRRCLEKDPRRRLSSLGDARLELDETEPAPAPPATNGTPPRSLGLPIIAGVVVASIAATVGVMRWLSPATPPIDRVEVAHVAIALPDGDAFGEANRFPLALSPDGRTIAYVGTRDGKSQLYLRKLSEREPTPLGGTDGGVTPFFSPDGRWVAFFAQGKLKKVSADGGGLQVVCDDTMDSRGGSWSTDGNIYFAGSNTTGIWRVGSSGGTATELTRVDRGKGEISHRWPHVLPDGATMLFTIWTGPGADESRIVVQSLATGERHELLPGGDSPRFLASGYLVYARNDDLFALPWHPGQYDVATTAPIALSEHARMENEGAAAYAISNNGTLVYLAGGAMRYAQRVVWVDRAGTVEPLAVPEHDFEAVAISPDGSQAVMQVESGTTGLWLYDFSRHTLSPFVTSGGSSQAPIWTPDGKHVVYRATRNGSRNLYWKATDGGSEEERLTTHEGVVQTPTSCSPDGRWLIFNEAGGTSRAEATIWKLRLDGDRQPEQVVDSSSAGFDGQLSPDGKWLAFVSGASGVREVCLRPFPGPGPTRQVSVGGGAEPRWTRDGRELLYVAGDKLMTSEMGGQPRVVHQGRFRAQINGNTSYDVSTDGRRFLRIQQAQPDAPLDHFDVVLNWGAELKRLAAAK